MTAAKTLIVGLVAGVIALGTIKEIKKPRKGGGLITTINDLNIPGTYGISAEKLARQTGLYHQPIYLSDEFIITSSEQGDTFWIQRIFGYKNPMIISKVPLGLPLKGISKTTNSFLLGLQKLDPFPEEQEQDSAITPETNTLTPVQSVATVPAEAVAPATLSSENFIPEGVKTLRYSAQGKYVTRLHISLENVGYQINSFEIKSQFFGKSTEQSVRDFQRKKGFMVDGVVGERTMVLLGLRRGVSPQNNAVTSSKKETPKKEEETWKPQIPTKPIQQPILPERRGKTLKKSYLTASR